MDEVILDCSVAFLPPSKEHVFEHCRRLVRGWAAREGRPLAGIDGCKNPSGLASCVVAIRASLGMDPAPVITRGVFDRLEQSC